LADNQLNDVFIRFKSLADLKKEVFDDDLIALVGEDHGDNQSYKLGLTSLHVVCGTEGPQKAVLELKIDDEVHFVTATGDGPVDATFNAVKELFPHTATLQLYQVHAVTEGTDAQATVTVRMEEDGKIATGQSADTDTVVASAKAYINALNKMVIKREKSLPGEDIKSVSYKDAG
jgi:2-isopropylmalate synthase